MTISNWHAWVGALAAMALGCWHPAVAAPIRGAGATFPAPLYLAWAAAYQRAQGIQIAYEPVGSGAGIDRIQRHAVDFGATDAPLNPQQLAESGLVQFPVIIGAVVPVINISGIKPGELRLTGAVLADIYLGRIRRWNDDAIRGLNPGIALPSSNITVVQRSDASGSSLLWSDYLARSSAQWQAIVGAALLPHWPVGTGGIGNEGVASYVQRTRFAIGYVEYSFAREHHLSDVSLLNHDGRFVQARAVSLRAAVAAASWSLQPGQQLPTDLSGPDSWPLTGASFILVSGDGESANIRAVLSFFAWGLQHGESLTQQLGYVSLPQTLSRQLPQLWTTIHDNTGQPAWP